MDEGKRVEIAEIDLKDVADLCKAIFLYARGGDFRPVPQGDLLWLICALVGVGRYNGRFSFLGRWRKTCLNHGLDPATGEWFEEAAFETAVKTLVAKNEHRHQFKEARKAKRSGEVSSSESNDKQESAPGELTAIGIPEPDQTAPMLRAIQRKLGPKRVTAKPLDWNLSKPPKPDPAIIPAPPTGSIWDENYQPEPPPAKPSTKYSEPDPGEIEAIREITGQPEAGQKATSSPHLEAIAQRSQAEHNQPPPTETPDWDRLFKRGPG
jgi:hypothetical protein